jgi:inhibitor of the pro-sigma K processing machinery
MTSSALSITAFVVALLILVLFGKLLIWPIKKIFKLVVNGVLGGLLLLILNFFGKFIGVTIGINIVTSLVAGILGLPGVLLLLILKYIFKV